MLRTLERIVKAMLELERLAHQRKCHIELTYSSVTDWMMKLWLKAYNDDSSDLVIFEEQHCDLDYLISKCKVAYKDWLSENNGGY